MKYRISIITQKGSPLSKNCHSIDECIEFYCQVDSKDGVKKYMIKNRETGQIEEKRLR